MKFRFTGIGKDTMAGALYIGEIVYCDDVDQPTGAKHYGIAQDRTSRQFTLYVSGGRPIEQADLARLEHVYDLALAYFKLVGSFDGFPEQEIELL